MSNRIDDQNLREQMYEDRGQAIKKQTTQSDFAKKIATQKTVQKQTNTQVAESKAKAGAPTTLMPKAATAKPATPSPTKTTQKAQSKKADSKDGAKKGTDAETKTEKKRSDLALETAVKKKQESKEDEGNFGESDAFFQQAAMSGITPQQIQNTQGPSAPVLSQDVINQLVDHIYSSTNSEGLKELTIELKSGALSGAQIQVSTSGGKVKLKFSSDDPGTKSLLRNSRNAIAQRLEQKNLSLAEFVVD